MYAVHQWGCKRLFTPEFSRETFVGLFSAKMDPKPDDTLNEIESTLSLKLDNLTLESLSNDIFGEPGDPKFSEYRDNKNLFFLSDDVKVDESDSNCEDSETEISVANTEENVEEYPNISERKKDINGNEDPLADENFNNSLDRLNISDSENESEESPENKTEEKNKDSSLRERGRVSGKRGKNQREIPYNRREHDRNQFNHQSLLFLSGSNYSQTDIDKTNLYSAQNNLTQLPEGINYCLPESGNDDQFNGTISTSLSINIHSQHKIVIPDCGISDFYNEDYGVNSVSSPESGYGTSIAGSPSQVQHFIAPHSEPDICTDSVDEELLDLFLDETTNTNNCASPVFLKNKEEIIEYLKASEKECRAKPVDDISKEKGSSTIETFDVSRNCMSVISNLDLSLVSPVTSVAITCESNQNGETCKPLACKPLNDKAKRAFKAVLSKDKRFIVQEKIYKDINKQVSENPAMKEEVKVIYVTDETDNKTNLHLAVLNDELEEIFCLVEIHKQYCKPFSYLNMRDRSGMTALDYAVQKNMTLVADYLMENNCCQNVKL